MKGSLPKLALPEGWIALNHRSGGIVYLHKPTRVCTWSRPYHIGGGSVRVIFDLLFLTLSHAFIQMVTLWGFIRDSEVGTILSRSFILKMNKLIVK